MTLFEYNVQSNVRAIAERADASGSDADMAEFAAKRAKQVRTQTVLVGQLLEAINFLHEEKVAHRDLKSDNILLDMDSLGKLSIICFTHT